MPYIYEQRKMPHPKGNAFPPADTTSKVGVEGILCDISVDLYLLVLVSLTNDPPFPLLQICGSGFADKKASPRQARFILLLNGTRITTPGVTTMRFPS